jgi:adenylate cyclase
VQDLLKTTDNEGLRSRKTAILFADIVGSTGLFSTLGNEQAMIKIAATLDRITGIAAAFGGARIKTIGDAVMIEFPSAMNACLAVVEMPLSPSPGQAIALPPLRVGIDFGEVVEENGDLYGDPVNVAAHICKRANPGGILATAAVEQAIPELIRTAFRPLGSFKIKDRPDPVVLYEIRRLADGDGGLTVMSTATGEAVRANTRIVLEYRGVQHGFLNSALPVTIGRGRENGINIISRKASRQHARIEWRSGQFHLIDTSSNGTSVYFGGDHTSTIRREELVLFGNGEIYCGGTREELAEDIVSFRVVA